MLRGPRWGNGARLVGAGQLGCERGKGCRTAWGRLPTAEGVEEECLRPGGAWDSVGVHKCKRFGTHWRGGPLNWEEEHGRWKGAKEGKTMARTEGLSREGLGKRGRKDCRVTPFGCWDAAHGHWWEEGGGASLDSSSQFHPQPLGDPG